MTSLLPIDEWLDVLDREYLSDFINRGGAAVKFAVGCEALSPEAIVGDICARARAGGFVTVELSATTTRVQLIDKIFDAVSGGMPWDELSTRVLRRLAEQNGLAVPEHPGESFEGSVADRNGQDPAFVRATLDRPLGQEVFRNRLLTKDFRLAMTWLCRARMRGGEEGATMKRDVESWLKGTATGSVMPKQYSIYSKVTRFNARYFFASLLRWVAEAGYPGTVIVVDISRLTVPKRPADGSNFYTKAALLDAYEVMRQFVDCTDELTNALLCFVGDEGLLDVEVGSRGLGVYQALLTRVFDEVRDREQVNPMGALVRLGQAAA